jgi:hypothetical protein
MAAGSNAGNNNQPTAPPPKLPPPKVEHIYVERGLGNGRVEKS